MIRQSSPQRASFLPVFLILIAIGLSIAFAVSKLGVELNSHSDWHIEVDDIRTCLDENGPNMVFKHKTEPIWYLVCQINDTRWGLQAVTKDGKEKTAFSPGDMTYKAIKEYLDRFAVRWKSNLPWLK